MSTSSNCGHGSDSPARLLPGRVPAAEKVIDLVLTASYAILGRWKEEYDSSDVTRAVELLDALGCAHLIRRRFATLSEGERKRVQIARAMMPNPEILLLDEPAAGLDLGGREDLLRRLATLAQDPKAPMMVLVTHHVEEVPDGFTHAMLLRGARSSSAAGSSEVFTARNLSRCFGVPLDIERHQNRWRAWARLLSARWQKAPSYRAPGKRLSPGGTTPRTPRCAALRASRWAGLRDPRPPEVGAATRAPL